jgi:ferrochelatase
VILSKRPFSSGEAYRGIWNEERDESPLRTITRDQTEKVAERMAARHGEKVVVDFACATATPRPRA